MSATTETITITPVSLKAIALPVLLLVIEFYLAYLYMKDDVVEITMMHWRTALIYAAVAVMLTAYAFTCWIYRATSLMS